MTILHVEAKYEAPPKPDGTVTITLTESSARTYLRETRGSCLLSTKELRKAIQDVLPNE